MRLLSAPGRTVQALAYAPGSQGMLFAACPRVLRAWDVASGDAIGDHPDQPAEVRSLAFSADGARVALGAASGRVIVRATDARTQNVAAVRLGEPVVCVAFTRDGNALLAVKASVRDDVDRQIECINLDPPAPPDTLAWSGNVETAAFCPARDLLAIAGRHRGVEFLEVGRSASDPAFFAASRVKALAFSPGDGRHLAVAGGKTVGIWDVDDQQWRAHCAGHRGDVNVLAFAPDGRTLLTGGMDRSVRLFETFSGRQLAAWEWKVGVIRALAFGSDGMTAAAAGDKPQVVVWDVDEG